MTKTVLWVIGGILAIGIVICGAALFSVKQETVAGNTSDILTARTDCSIPSDAVAESYSATVIAPQDYTDAIANTKSLIAQYQGNVLTMEASSYTTQTGPRATDYANTTSTSITANIPVANADVFMNDFQNKIGADDILKSPYFSKTTSKELISNCMDALNNIRTARYMTNLYGRNLSKAIVYNSYDSSDASDSTDYSNGTNGTLDSINSQLESWSSGIESYNDSLSSLDQSINQLSFSVTFQMSESPTPYYPDSYPDGSGY